MKKLSRSEACRLGAIKRWEKPGEKERMSIILTGKKMPPIIDNMNFKQAL